MTTQIQRENLNLELLELVNEAEMDFGNFFYNIMDERDRELTYQLCSHDTIDVILVWDGNVYEFAWNDQTNKFEIYMRSLVGWTF